MMASYAGGYLSRGSMSTFDIYFCIILFFVLIISGYYASKREKKFNVTRLDFISKFSFKEEGDIYRELHKHGFRLLNFTDEDYEVCNIIRKECEKEDVYIFDFVYTSKYADRSNSSKPSTLRAVFFKFKSKKLYSFELFPENVFEKIKQLFGFADIDFSDHPNFSKRYVLKGEDESEVRARFPKQLITNVENLKGVCIEARESCLLTYNLHEGEFADYEKLYKNAVSFADSLK
ncbi:hypothetical protein [Algibacillus agarilyticus]|uniref:hypothetical protein n=1 Tax=Algibacillus agarilyticus TaxID=2234133 RepID=UPI0013005D75|nr:hypothetical protein [Algibacillus agarilyticus]